MLPRLLLVLVALVGAVPWQHAASLINVPLDEVRATCTSVTWASAPRATATFVLVTRGALHLFSHTPDDCSSFALLFSIKALVTDKGQQIPIAELTQVACTYDAWSGGESVGLLCVHPALGAPGTSTLIGWIIYPDATASVYNYWMIPRQGKPEQFSW